MKIARINLLGFLLGLGFAGLTAAEPTMLTDDQIENTIAGNTLSDGSKWAEYYWHDGVIARKSYRGRWLVKDSTVCFDYTGTKYDGCYQMAAEDDEVRLYSEDGNLQRALRLTNGNPRNLTPAHASGVIDKTFFGGIAIKGYDPVAYFAEGQPMKGSAKFSQEWLGATWHFANAKHKDAFSTNPEKYMPQFGGYCSNAMSKGVVKSLDPEAWRIVDGKLYVFASMKGRDKWEKDIRGKIANAKVNWPEIKADLPQ